MLYFRRICLLVALALTFGASDVFAQGAPAGISVRIVSPADSAWVGIGGKIVVDVSSRPLLSGIRATGNTDTTFITGGAVGRGIDEVLLYVDRTGEAHDKTVSGGAGRTLTNFPSAVGPANDFQICFANLNNATVSGNKRKVTWDKNLCKITGEVRSFQGGTHVARYTFEIKQTLDALGVSRAADFRTGVSGIYAVAAARTTDLDADNTKDWQAVANVEAGGDGKFIRIDTGRPVQSAADFDSVGVLGKIGLNSGAGEAGSFKIGDKIELVAGIAHLTSEVVSIQLGLFGFDGDYHPDYMRSRDSALVKSLTTFKVLEGGASIEGAENGFLLKKTVTVEENAFKIVGDESPDDDSHDATEDATTYMDNLKFKVAVFFVDRAGNIGSDMLTGDAMPYSTDAVSAVHTVDSKKPKIMIRNPNLRGLGRPDSSRFTALLNKSFASYRANNGGTDNVEPDFRPLELSVDESLDSLTAIVVTPKDSLARSNILDEYTETGSFIKIATDSFKTAGNKDLPSSTKGGQKVDLMIVARDEVGNRATKTVEGVVHDADLPNHVRAFPLASTAPLDGDTPTITDQTRHPVLRFNEALDSLSVRFIQTITNGPDTAIQDVSGGQLSMVNKDITVTVQDTLRHLAEYDFQYYARDLAGNVHILPRQTLTYKRGFQNPTANKFIVTANKDSARAGQNIVLTITAVDSAIRRADSSRGNAVTYRSDVRVSAWDGDDRASTVVFAGNGGSSVAKNADGTYNVAGSGWNAAEVKVAVKSNKVIDNFSVLVEDVTDVTVDGETTTTVNFNGRKDSLYVDADRMEKFAVTAWEDGEETKVVSGEFQVNVIPTDKHGNPSIKRITGDAALDTRIANANKFTNFNVLLQTANPRAELPGAQRMVLSGKTFTVIAPNGNGKLTITAIVDGVEPGATAKYLVATGSVTVDYSASAPAPAPADSLAAPAYLTVVDVPDDQGHYVRVTFPLSTDHNVIDSYRLYRELDLGDGSGPRFIRWGDDFEPSGADSLVTEHVAVPDAMATHWAIEAIGAKPSGQTVSGKLSAAVVASPRTLTEAPVGAIDNSPPEAASNVMFENADAVVSWTLSPSEGPTGETWIHPLFTGSPRDILGVTGYEIWVGLSADAMYSVGKVDAGESSFALTTEVIASLIARGAITQAQLAELVAKDLVGVMVRVDALDLSNSVPSEIFTVQELTRRAFTSADGAPVYIVALDDDMTVDFTDFMAFAAAYNTRDGDDAWNIQADLNDDGTVNFADFILFISSYGKTAQGPATKPVILPPGVNENAEFSLRLGSERVVVGQNVFVDVSLANVQDLMGYGFVLNYDADKFEFVEAAPADQDLLKSTGGETPLFSSLANEAGQVSIANAVVNASEISGGGDIVRLTFRVLQEFAENARFEIAEGLVFDPQQLSNPAVVAGVLDVQTTPTEFALLQNFPNPFNPETTIGYELAESADVTLQIYNVVGQVVRTLIVAEPQSAGRYQIRWDGMDDRGVSVSSGVYFYRISAGEFQTVRKLMLLK